MYKRRDITVVIPALNEALAISTVVDGLFRLRACQRCDHVFQELSATEAGEPQCVCHAAPATTDSGPESDRLVDRILVCDNGSTDDTAALAASSGAIVTHEPEQGYGAACLAALAIPVEKDIVVFVDADNSVVATELPGLVDPLFDGADLVIGSRELGTTEKGALSIPQQFGNKLASFLISTIWSSDVTDLGPFRATTQATLKDLEMKDRKFGWTVEMQVRALQLNKTVVEVAVSTRRRIGKSKISGTLLGVIGAAHGILGTIFKLYLAGLGKRVLPNLNARRN